jgi:DNA-binding NtrC family response regulator
MTSRIKRPIATILVVDDDRAVLDLVAEVLESGDFKVVKANSPEIAIELANNPELHIDLLLSDVDMPGMSGPDLGQLLKERRQKLHVMLMSGAADGSLLVINDGWAFIQKPFVAVKLVRMVKDVLGSQDRSQPGGQEFDSRKDRKDYPDKE